MSTETDRDDDLVPENFDLNKALRAKSTTPVEKRNRCPECGTISIVSKSQRECGRRMMDSRYFCEECYLHFDNPIRGDLGE